MLVDHCYECHSGASAESELRVDSLGALLSGGTRGPAIVPGKPAESIFISAVNHGELLKMPPKDKLPTAKIAAFVRWVNDGAVWPDAEPVVRSRSPPAEEPMEFSEAQREHWSFQPLEPPSLPPVENASWPRSPIDRFVLAQLEVAGLSPAPDASRHDWLRRVTYDLTGLPPLPRDVDAFLGDASPLAFERVVDQLLASPRYGERWGRHWLDVARYADSNGLDENLAYANAYHYRDYVIRAFNDDMPYDRFVREQIAGDLIEYADPDDAASAMVGTGFLTLGAKMLAEDDPVKMQMDIIDEQVDTVGKAFMGLTFGCARCHDHKFDPLPTADYYSLAGIFKSTKTMENFKVVARWQERPIADPELIEERERLQKELAVKKAAIAELVRAARLAVLERERQATGTYLIAATERWLRQRLAPEPYGDSNAPADTPGVRIIEADQYVRGNVNRDFDTYGKGIGVLVNRGETPNFVEYDIHSDAAGLYQFELRYAAQDARPCSLSINGEVVATGVAGQTTGSWTPEGQKWFVEGVYRLHQGKNVLRLEQPRFFPHIDKILIGPPAEVATGAEVALREVVAAREEAQANAGAANATGVVGEIVERWVTLLENTRGDPSSVLAPWHRRVGTQASGPSESSLGSDLVNRLVEPSATIPPSESLLSEMTLAEVASSYERRIFGAALEGWNARRRREPKAAGLETPVLEAARQLLFDENGPFVLTASAESHFDAPTQQRLTSERAAVAGLEESIPKLPTAMAVSEGAIEDVRVHLRGSHITQGATVPRRFPRILDGEARTAIAGDRSGRLELARWLTRSEHPLTARVMANRLWLWHFGEGLVRTPDNFGLLGLRPTHPELLDWLAHYFSTPLNDGGAGWSLKRMHRLIVLSSAYRMNTRFDERAYAIDPENKLRWRMSRRRLSAEELRDSILAVADGLELSMGGTLLPTKNRAYVTSTANVNPVAYKTARRTVYMPVVRSALYDMLQAFDFADPSVLNGQRASTTIAPQALFMLNGEIVAEAAQSIADRALAATDDGGARVVWIYRRILGRPPREKERAVGLDFLERFEVAALAAGVSAAESPQRAWKSYCRTLLASNEFVYVE